jgi:hypothetical protein
MLPPFIIEQIRKREDDERRRQDPPVKELPLPAPMPSPREPRRRDEEQPKRGVVIIDLGA